MTLPNFPQFAELKLEDKEDYNAFVSKWPPFSDISFTTLHIWWNLDGQLRVSSLNGNLIIQYNLPFDKANSGIGIVGGQQIDESIEKLLAYLRQHNKQPRIVHLPEFTAEKIRAVHKYEVVEESEYHEYIMSSRQLASLEGSPHAYTRKKVKRFLREVEGRSLEVKPLDLALPENKDMLLENLLKWQTEFASKNDPQRSEDLALQKTLTHSEHLETQNLCIFIDGKFHGIVLYHLAHDKNHYILNHLKVDYSVLYMFDYLTNQVAIKAVNDGVEYLNMEMDLGLPGLRQHKMGLRPVHFLKKYTVTAK